MADGVLTLGTRRYSSWSMRGWLAVRLAELDVEERVVPIGQPGSGLADLSPSGLVPVLEHRGARLWDSLSIGEYCAELRPALWPSQRVARAWARSASAEMHAGFRALRVAMPMNLGRPDYAALGERLIADPAVAADLARIATIWREAITRSGGPFLFGGSFGLVDAMFAPVAARLLTFRPTLDGTVLAPGQSGLVSRYVEAVRAHPLVARWYDDASLEPQEWHLARYETLL